MGHVRYRAQGAYVYDHAAGPETASAGSEGLRFSDRRNRPRNGGQMKIFNRVRFWWARPRLHDELTSEIDSHRQMLEEEFAAEGMSPRDARAAALRRFGNRPGS